MNRKNTAIFSSKANTLAYLRPLVKYSQVGDQVTFTVSDWQASRGQVLETITKRFPDRQLIVRSSAIGEDSTEQS